MTFDSRNPDPSPDPCLGFVVAMRAKLVDATRPSLYEWLIVSRWGTEGNYLSIAWTSLPARPGEAPIDLMPRQTALAIRREQSAAWAPATFLLASSLPEGVTVAGDFVPAEGYVRLYGKGAKLRARSEGQCLRPELRAAWHVEATRARWIGEFIEVAPDVIADPLRRPTRT